MANFDAGLPGDISGIIGRFGTLPGNDNNPGNDNSETGSSVSTVRFADTYKKVKLPDSDGITFIVAKGKNIYDMSQLVQSITWSGAKSAMPRTLEVTMLDSDQHGKIRPDIDVEAGQQCLFMYNGQELFRGIFFSSSHYSCWFKWNPTHSFNISLRPCMCLVTHNKFFRFCRFFTIIFV